MVWVLLDITTTPPLAFLAASAGYIEWQAHESFAESRRRLYSSTPEIKATMRRLTEFAVSCLDEPVSDPVVESFTHRAHSFSKFLKK